MTDSTSSHELTLQIVECFYFYFIFIFFCDKKQRNMY